MVRRHRHRKRLFPVTTCILMLAIISLIALLLIACGTEEVTPTPEEVTPAPEAVTPAPEEATPAPEEVTPAPEEVAPIEFPWDSMLIMKHEEFGDPMKIGAISLQVNIDLGREFSPDELNSLRDTVRDEVKLIDEEGREFHPASGFALAMLQSYTENGEHVYWQSGFAYRIIFDVKSKTCDYTLFWPDYPPLEIGNPFETLFVLKSQ